MTDIVKKLAPEILNEIKKAKNILLHCHPSPDPDSVGSVLAMKLALEQLGKNVTAISGDNIIPKAFQFPGVETIIQKNFFEININEFDLFIILDSGSIEMISKKDKVVFSDSLMTIVIDHHASNKGYGKINLIDTNYSSTTQLLRDLFNEMGININQDIALNLFMGIYTDTGGFRYCKNLSETLKVSSELSSIAPNITETIFTMENSNRKERLIFEGLALCSLKEFLNGKLVITFVTYDQLLKNNIKDEDYSSSFISNTVKSVIGFDIAIAFIEQKQNVIKIGIRTRDSKKYDLSKLAVALGGGGHVAAAGATLNMTLELAIDKVVKTAKEIYNL